MADVRKYMRLTGNFTLETDKGAMTFAVVGVSPPPELKNLGAYVGKLVDEIAGGATAGEANMLKERIAQLEAKLAEAKEAAATKEEVKQESAKPAKRFLRES